MNNEKYLFLLPLFDNDYYDGIGEQLILNGYVYVYDNPFDGGIGNHIKQIDEKKLPYLFDCIKLEFNAEEFCKKDNVFFIDFYNSIIESKKENLKAQDEIISKLSNELFQLESIF